MQCRIASHATSSVVFLKAVCDVIFHVSIVIGGVLPREEGNGPKLKKLIKSGKRPSTSIFALDCSSVLNSPNGGCKCHSQAIFGA